MNNEHDELLNDLINYYDDETDSGNTIVLNTAEIEENYLDNTIIVDTDKIPVSDNEDTSFGDETIQIDLSTVPAPEIPKEEVLGSLDRAGRPIEAPPVSRVVRRSIDVDAPVYRASAPTAPKRPDGIWYALKPLWVTLIACATIIASINFYITDTGPIGIYKRNFSYNMSLILKVFGVEKDPYSIPSSFPIEESRISDILSATGLVVTAHAEEDVIRTEYKEISKKKATVPFQGADLAKFHTYDNGVVCAKTNYICFFDKNGTKKQEYQTPISEPILEANGKYVILAAKNSTQLSLYKNGKPVYSLDAPNTIKTCAVSEKGDVAVVMDKPAYKGAVSAFNAKGEEIFSWISGTNYITSVSITKNRQISVSLVSTEDSVKSYVMVFDVFTPDPINGAEFKDTLIYSTSAYKNTTYAYGDNSISSINKHGEIKYNITFDNKEISHTAEDENGWRAVMYTENHLPHISVYDRGGRLRCSAPAESVADCADLYKSVVVYNNGRDIICGKANSRTKTKYTAPMSVKNLVMINKDTYMVAYENSLEFIRI